MSKLKKLLSLIIVVYSIIAVGTAFGAEYGGLYILKTTKNDFTVATAKVFFNEKDYKKAVKNEGTKKSVEGDLSLGLEVVGIEENSIFKPTSFSMEIGIKDKIKVKSYTNWIIDSQNKYIELYNLLISSENITGRILTSQASYDFKLGKKQRLQLIDVLKSSIDFN